MENNFKYKDYSFHDKKITSDISIYFFHLLIYFRNINPDLHSQKTFLIGALS